MAGGEDGGQACRSPERPRLPAAAGAVEDPAGAFPGRARLAGEAGPEAGRGHRRRGACRGSPLVVELVEVGGEGRVLEPAAVRARRRADGAPRSTAAGVRGRARPRRGTGLERDTDLRFETVALDDVLAATGGGLIEGELVRPAPTPLFITADPNHRGRRAVRPRESRVPPLSDPNAAPRGDAHHPPDTSQRRPPAP